MSSRPVEEKKRRKIARRLRRKELPRYIDLIEYLVDRRMLPTKRYARLAIGNGYVRANSHVLRDRYVNADLRGAIMVVSPQND